MIAHKYYFFWFMVGLVLPAIIGFALDDLRGALDGLLWGGIGSDLAWLAMRLGVSTRCATCLAHGHTQHATLAAIWHHLYC